VTLSPEEIDAIGLSLRVAIWAVAMGLIPAILCALLLARCQFRGKTLIDAIIHLPLVVPPVVTGYLLIIILGRNAAFGSLLAKLGLKFAFNWKGAVLAALVMSFPLMVRAIRLSIEAVDKGLESAAHTLGAGRFRIFMTITLPLSLPGIITGSVLGFARSLGEFGATITFVSNIPGETQTLPLALYTFTQTPDGEMMAARLCGIAIIISVTALACSEVVARRAAKRISG
jgi:molybdate transport system permease protein